MNYEETVKFLYSSLPASKFIGKRAYKSNLNNILSLSSTLNNPHLKFKSIHVAGTNGKGSVSHIIATILNMAGYKTGLYTSPHLKDFTERIIINGVYISKEYVVKFVEELRLELKRVGASFFEMTVALAFDYFAHSQVDIAVVEVGLGGRLDSTNIISPELSVITNVSLDHTDLLGNTLEEIAIEKSGIIKTCIPVVIGERQKGVEDVFLRKVKETGSQIFFASDNIRIDETADGLNSFLNSKLWLPHFNSNFKGLYQRKNISTALQVCHTLRLNGFNISDEAIIRGIEIAGTTFKGRWQQIGEHPTVICDTCHNPAGIREAMVQLQSMSFNKLHIIFGLLKDKDLNSILPLLIKEAQYYFCQPKTPRALDSRILAQKARSFQLFGEVIVDVNQAIMKAKRKATPRDLIFIGGSNFVVGEIENL